MNATFSEWTGNFGYSSMRWLELKTQDVFRFVNDYVEGFSKVKENCKELTNKFSLSITTGVCNTFIFFFFFLLA